MAKVVKKSVAPIYAVAVLWLIWGLFFPLYKPFHFILAAIASAVVFCVGRALCPAKKIIACVVQDPEKLPQIRRFMNYYLPTTLKLLNAYDRMADVGVSGENIDGTKGRIEDIMQTIVTAFDKQLDALFGDEALDISTDIDVMEQMLAREGIGGVQFPTES